MKPWADFYPLVLTDVIGCPYPVVDQALLESAREFCLKTKSWVETDEFQAEGDTNRFDFALPVLTELVEVRRASVDGQELKVFGTAKLPTDWQTKDPEHDALFHETVDEYLIFPRPSAGQTIKVVSAVRPTLRGTGVGDDCYRFHAEGIAAGAKYRLFKKPRTDWRDLQLAEIALGEFNRAVSDAANRDFMHTQPGARRVKHWG